VPYNDRGGPNNLGKKVEGGGGGVKRPYNYPRGGLPPHAHVWTERTKVTEKD
jgi:hypothetical protein